jgi:hypothetical protein
MLHPDQVVHFHREGWLLVPELLSVAEITQLKTALETLEQDGLAAAAATGGEPPSGLTYAKGRMVMADGEPILERVQQLVGGPVKLTGCGYLDGGRPNAGHYWCAAALCGTQCTLRCLHDAHRLQASGYRDRGGFAR